MENIVIFGGLGFIGLTLANEIAKKTSSRKIYVVDSEEIHEKPSSYRKQLLLNSSKIIPIKLDIRSEINWTPDVEITAIFNFAAVHREPGHEDYEYYQTNLLGAEHVCNWAEKLDCKKIIFTSSISPYGPSEEARDERSLPVPTTAYGGSKLVAEKIHQTWQAKDTINRHLVIVRPGVVFGPSEGGNVSRLIKAVLHRYFFYMGNRNTRKAGTYVKELCNAMLWVLERQEKTGDRFNLFNMSMNPGPSIEEYVEAVCSVGKVRRYVPSIPYPALLTAAYCIDLLARPLGLKHPFSPVRIRKLVRSNNILPNWLIENGYTYQYTLNSAFEDWKNECPDEWK